MGNTDRHWWELGILVDNRTNWPQGLHPLMDFNRTFNAYDTLDGANCLTVRPRLLTQREAAEEAVRKIGFSQQREIKAEWFNNRQQEYEMLMRRREVLVTIS